MEGRPRGVSRDGLRSQGNDAVSGFIYFFRHEPSAARVIFAGRPRAPMPGSLAAGRLRMAALAADLPNGLLTGFRAGRELALPNGHGSIRVFAVGMGGSAIAADLVRGVVEAESRTSLSVVRSNALPGGVDARSRVVILSYSGETGETLRAYAAAGRAGASRVVVTSGGTLAERAEEDRVPVLTLPAGVPARAAIGHLLGGLLGLLDPSFPESNERRVAGIAERLRAEIGRYARPAGTAGEVATQLADRTPYIYAESSFAALARRWATQVEENAKRLAVFDEVPEAFHNAVVGWSRIRPTEARRCAAVLIEWAEEEAAVRRGMRAFERVLSRRSVRTVRVTLPSEDRLEALLQGVALGDQVSLRLAEREKVDPLPVEAIDRLRATLAGR